eukprot:gene33122-37423_t
MRILLIEDDRKAARLLARGLEEEGFVVDAVHSAEEGDERAFVQSMRPAILSLADLSLDPQRQRAQRGGATLDLTHKEFAILHMLLRHAGEVVSRARLAEQVWKDDLIGIDNLIDVHMGNLRRKVDAAPAAPLIRTVGEEQILLGLTPGRITPLHKRRVEQAGFMVLKSPEIASILVETGFVSNPNEA